MRGQMHTCARASASPRLVGRRRELPLAAGTQIVHYRVVSPLGAGGMGEVYLAVDTRLDRKIALKLLPAHFTANEDRVWRFLTEAKAASAINHPGILTIYDVGKIDDLHFIASEFVEGRTLRDRIASGPLPPLEALDVAIQVANA